MATKKHPILCITDSSEKLAQCKELLEPVYSYLGWANGVKDALFRMENQDYELLVVNCEKAVLEEDRGILSQLSSQERRTKNKVPVVVLSEGVEDEKLVVKRDSLKFIAHPFKAEDLYKLIDGSLFTTDKSSGNPVSVEFINPLVNAVVEVLKTMASLELEKGKPYVREKGAEPTTKGDISGLIAIQSDRFAGSLAITFQKSLILQVYQNMMMEEKGSIDEDVKDSVMEITNIVFGNAKRDLNKVGHTIQPAIPSVITGENHEVRHSLDGVCLVLPFNNPAGILNVECLIAMNK